MDLEKCRSLLPADLGLSDVELERLRDALYTLAGVAVEGFLEERNALRSAAKAAPPSCETSVGEARNERAAILEFDAGVRREQAERIVGLRKDAPLSGPRVGP